jgi:segregation and condensation protein B
VEFLNQHIESLIFTAKQPITIAEIGEALEHTFEMQFRKVEIKEAIGEIEEKYQDGQFSFEVVGIADGYQFLTKGAYFNTVAMYLKQTTKKKLSRAALETLSIIAYKQPVSRPEMEKIRGVSCDYALQKLLEKELVTIVGRSESVGKPLLYGTSEKFMDYFGLKSLEDLPKPKDFTMPDTSIGEAAPIEEEVSVFGQSHAVPAHPSGITNVVTDVMSAVLSLDTGAPTINISSFAEDEEE